MKGQYVFNLYLYHIRSMVMQKVNVSKEMTTKKKKVLNTQKSVNLSVQSTKPVKL